LEDRIEYRNKNLHETGVFGNLALTPSPPPKGRGEYAIPGVGALTIDVVLSELGDVRRFHSQKDVAAYAGLVPVCRESAGKVKQGGITKEGSRLLRWILVEAAWRLTSKTRRWSRIYDRLAVRKGKKRAIVAVARRLLCVMASMLQSGKAYQWPEEPSARKAKRTCHSVIPSKT
jgi:transposase